MRKHFILSLTLIFTVLSCKKDIDPENGFSQNIYLKFDFDSTSLKFEEESMDYEYDNKFNVIEQAYYINTGSGPAIFFNPIGDAFVKIEFENDPSKEEIENLEGKSISLKPGTYPFVTVAIDRGAIGSYVQYEWFAPYFNFDTINFNNLGNQYFIVDKVIEGNRITYTQNATFQEKKARSYYLRGRFEFDSHFNFTPDTNNNINLHKVKNGEFSILIFAP